MSDPPTWMGCSATDKLVTDFSITRLTRELGSEPDAWSAAQATLIYERPVRFERPDGTGFYLAPYDPNIVGCEARAIIVGHIELADLIREEDLPVVHREQVPAEILTPYRVRFYARVPCETVIHATSPSDAHDRARSDFEGHAKRLVTTAHANILRWRPLPTDFEFIGAEYDP
jgi:hypothetical protein